MSFWKESAFIISEIGKGVVLNAQNIINVLRNNTDGLGAIKTGVDDANSALGNSTNGLAAIKTDVDNANSALYNSGFGLGAIKTAVDAIGSGGSSVIKSIQSGTYSYTVSGTAYGLHQAYVTINAVNVSKSFILVSFTQSQSWNDNCYACGLISSSTDILLKFNTVNKIDIIWQVIEFN